MLFIFENCIINSETLMFNILWENFDFFLFTCNIILYSYLKLMECNMSNALLLKIFEFEFEFSNCLLAVFESRNCTIISTDSSSIIQAIVEYWLKTGYSLQSFKTPQNSRIFVECLLKNQATKALINGFKLYDTMRPRNIIIIKLSPNEKVFFWDIFSPKKAAKIALESIDYFQLTQKASTSSIVRIEEDISHSTFDFLKGETIFKVCFASGDCLAFAGSEGSKFICALKTVIRMYESVDDVVKSKADIFALCCLLELYQQSHDAVN